MINSTTGPKVHTFIRVALVNRDAKEGAYSEPIQWLTLISAALCYLFIVHFNFLMFFQ